MGHNIRRILLHITLHINYLEQNRIAEKPIYVEKIVSNLSRYDLQ